MLGLTFAVARLRLRSRPSGGRCRRHLQGDRPRTGGGRRATPLQPPSKWTTNRGPIRLIRITQTMARGEPMRKLFAGSMQQRSGIISGAVC